MKLLKLSSCCLVIFSLVFASCSKYEEGPAISLRSKKERVVNTWNADKFVTEQGNDATDFGEITLTFEENGDYTTEINAFGRTNQSGGTWEFRNDKEDLAIIPEDPTEEEDVFTIILLKEDEMKLEGDGQAEVELSEK